MKQIENPAELSAWISADVARTADGLLARQQQLKAIYGLAGLPSPDPIATDLPVITGSIGA